MKQLLTSDKRIRLDSCTDIRTDKKEKLRPKSVTSTHRARNMTNTAVNLKRKQDMPQGNQSLRRPVGHQNLLQIFP